MYALGKMSEFSATDLKSRTCYMVESKGINIIIRECSVKEIAIDEIKSQPFFNGNTTSR